jgi:hypothetical protein
MDTLNNAALGGTVTDKKTSAPVVGAIVSAQIFNPGAGDEKDKVAVFTSTISDASGHYTMYLKPGDYLVVATADGHRPLDAAYTAVANAVNTQDFPLDAEEMAAVSGRILLNEGDEGEVTISFRTESMVTDGASIEVASLRIEVANDGEPVGFSQDLPYETYKIVASLADHETKIVDVFDVNEETVTIDDFDWSTP